MVPRCSGPLGKRPTSISVVDLWQHVNVLVAQVAAAAWASVVTLAQVAILLGGLLFFAKKKEPNISNAGKVLHRQGAHERADLGSYNQHRTLDRIIGIIDAPIGELGPFDASK